MSEQQQQPESPAISLRDLMAAQDKSEGKRGLIEALHQAAPQAADGEAETEGQ
jgi:hypothetical protein